MSTTTGRSGGNKRSNDQKYALANKKKKPLTLKEIDAISFQEYALRVTRFSDCTEELPAGLNCVTAHWGGNLRLGELRYCFNGFAPLKGDKKALGNYARELISKAVVDFAAPRFEFKFNVMLKRADGAVDSVPCCRGCFQVTYNVSKHAFDTASGLLKNADSAHGTNLAPGLRAFNESTIMEGQTVASVRKIVFENLFEPYEEGTTEHGIQQELVVNAMAPFGMDQALAVSYLRTVMSIQADQSPERIEAYLSVSAVFLFALSLHSSSQCMSYAGYLQEGSV